MVTINNSINNQVGGANNGVTNTLSVINTVDAANSGATVQITTAGSSATDPKLAFTITGQNSVSMGLDNSVNDNFSISVGTALGTTEMMTMVTNGATIGQTAFTLGDVGVVRSNAGGAVKLSCKNMDTVNANSYSAFVVGVEDTDVADPQIGWNVNGGNAFVMGLSNANGDALRINSQADAATIGGPMWQMTTAGEVTMPTQPAFSAYLASADSNVTGDNTSWTLGSVTALTEVFDQNADFNVNGTFTAPVTGRYRLGTCYYVQDIGAGHTKGFITFNTSNRLYYSNTISPAASRASTNDMSLSVEIFADMDAADTATTTIQVDNSTKTIDILGLATNFYSYFYGNLQC